MDPTQQTLLMKLYRSDRGSLTVAEMQLRRQLIADFKDVAAGVEADVYQTFAAMGGEEWDFTAVRRAGRDRYLLDQINNRIQALGGTIQDNLGDGLLDQFKQAYLDGVERIDKVTPESVEVVNGLLPDQEIFNVLAEPWSGAKFSDRLGLITDDMAHNVQHEIIKSMMAGESWQETGRRIRSEMGTQGQGSVWRAEMVARTELSHAMNMANAQLYDDNSDILEEPVWVAHPGACDICRENHGRPVSEVGYPPDDSHPNCECGVLAYPKADVLQ